MMLVSLAAALFVVLTISMSQSPAFQGDTHVRADPPARGRGGGDGRRFSWVPAASSRHAVAVRRFDDRCQQSGMVGAIGAACKVPASNDLAAIATLMAFLILTVLGYIERRVSALTGRRRRDDKPEAG